jgi:CheY-like chemotaxis protein
MGLFFLYSYDLLKCSPHQIEGKIVMPVTSWLKIIALTSFAMQGDRETFMSAGFDGYLSKPINTRELSGLIIRWLDMEDHP